MSNPGRERVWDNIREHGWHYYRIFGGPTPPWSYTIGFAKTWDMPELVLAGASVFLNPSVGEAFQELGRRIQSERPEAGTTWGVLPIGEVRFGEIDVSWKEELLLGDVDYYDGTDFPALQVIPAGDPLIDVPDMARPVVAALLGPWRWLDAPWPYDLPERAQVMTDTLALRGEPVTLVNRNDESDWDAWATTETDVPEEIVCIAPWGTLLATDETLAETLELEPGHYAARDYVGDPWRVWDL